jgi:hypothetical protein
MRSLKRIIIPGLISVGFIISSLVVIAFASTNGKTEIEYKFHINKQRVLESVYGESPTFAIWMEDPVSGANRTIFVTSRAGLGDWEGKAEVPEALPRWDEVRREEIKSLELSGKTSLAPDAISGATPEPGYFIERVRVAPGSKWICWIEMNLSGDYNGVYKQYDDVKKTEDEYATGQPALLYQAKVEAREGCVVIPTVVGMSVFDSDSGAVSLQSLKGITTALEVFDEMSISVVRPKPKLIGRNRNTLLTP